MLAPTKKPVSKKSLKLRQVRKEVETRRDSNELLLPQIFNDQIVNQIAQKFGPVGRQRVYSIPKTLGLFVQQVLSKSVAVKKSCIVLMRREKPKIFFPSARIRPAIVKRDNVFLCNRLRA